MRILHMENVECSKMINLEKELYAVPFKVTLPHYVG